MAVKITRIAVKGFRGFKDECVIDLSSRLDLLLYGENGSGKSSLYQALNMFFAPNTPFGDHKNIFVTTEDGFVKLEIGDVTNPSKTYEWETTTHPFTETLIAEASKTKGFLTRRFEHGHGSNSFPLQVINGGPRIIRQACDNARMVLGGNVNTHRSLVRENY